MLRLNGFALLYLLTITEAKHHNPVQNSHLKVFVNTKCEGTWQYEGVASLHNVRISWALTGLICYRIWRQLQMRRVFEEAGCNSEGASLLTRRQIRFSTSCCDILPWFRWTTGGNDPLQNFS